MVLTQEPQIYLHREVVILKARSKSMLLCCDVFVYKFYHKVGYILLRLRLLTQNNTKGASHDIDNQMSCAFIIRRRAP